MVVTGQADYIRGPMALRDDHILTHDGACVAGCTGVKLTWCLEWCLLCRAGGCRDLVLCGYFGGCNVMTAFGDLTGGLGDVWRVDCVQVECR